MYVSIQFYKTYVIHISDMSEFHPIPTKYIYDIVYIMWGGGWQLYDRPMRF